MDKNLYIINYPVYEKELCKLEQKILFEKVTDGKHIFSDKYIDPSTSPFIKEVILVKYTTDSLEEIIDNIIDDKLSCEDFKVNYLKLENDQLSYEQRLKSIGEIGYNINGQVNIHEPKIEFALTTYKGKWIFGEHRRNDYQWHIHDRKPHSYSNSLGVRVAKALVNIAAGTNPDKRLIDPCCGVGTVVIEGLSLNLNICGCEINKQIASNARKNLEFFGYDKDIIKQGDMHNIQQKYDVSIIDLPYGLFTAITREEQRKIIQTARRISNEAVLIVFEDMKNDIEEAGFKIIDTCTVSKGKFIRIIHRCI